jgi:hypothetical protein
MELTFSSGFASLSLGRVLVKFLSRFTCPTEEALNEYRGLILGNKKPAKPCSLRVSGLLCIWLDA